MSSAPAPLVLVCSLLLASLAVAPLHPRPQSADEPTRAPFDVWLEGLRTEALTRGIRPQTLKAALAGVAPVERVLERDRNQTEFRLTVDQYLRRRLTGPTVRMARRMAARYPTLLGRVSKAYGVDPRVLIAVWGLESNFGRFSGVRPMIPTLATLAWDDRRGEFFRGELLDALTIVDRGDIALSRLKGSWAGAMGQVQFMPSSYLAWAVDFDEDGDRDIWTSLPDVFASIAHYLQGHGWTSGVPWGYEVSMPDAAREAVAAMPLRSTGCRAARALTEPQPLGAWRTAGLVRTSGGRIPAADHQASLLRLDSRAFLVTVNYEALLGYNCAHTYALSVAMLADRLERD